MDFDTYFETVRLSKSADWLHVSHPVFLQEVGFATVGGEREAKPTHSLQHYSRYTLATDLSISMAMGLAWRYGERFHEPWAEKFPDPNATADYIDFLYNGAPIYRVLRVLVDGGRAGLPLPRPTSLEVPQRQRDVFRLIDEVSGSGEFDRYFAGAGLVETSDYWPIR